MQLGILVGNLNISFDNLIRIKSKARDPCKNLIKSMKIIILLSTLLSFPCWAEWVPISKNPQGDTTYVDNKSILIEGPHLYYWELYNYNKINQFGYMSAKILKQADCNSTAFQTLHFISFTKPMGRGEIIKNYNPNKKAVIAPWGSSNYHSLRAACKLLKKIQ